MPRLTETEQWKLGGDIMDQGLEHPAFKTMTRTWDEIEKKLAEVQLFSANLKKIGVGRTEDGTLIKARLVPALRDYADLVATVAAQLDERLG